MLLTRSLKFQKYYRIYRFFSFLFSMWKISQCRFNHGSSRSRGKTSLGRQNLPVDTHILHNKSSVCYENNINYLILEELNLSFSKCFGYESCCVVTLSLKSTAN